MNEEDESEIEDDENTNNQNGDDENEDANLGKREFSKDIKRKIQKKIKGGKIQLEWQDDEEEADLEKEELLEGLKNYSF